MQYQPEKVSSTKVLKFRFLMISGVLRASPASFSDISARSCAKVNATPGGCQAPTVLLLLAAQIHMFLLSILRWGWLAKDVYPCGFKVCVHLPSTFVGLLLGLVLQLPWSQMFTERVRSVVCVLLLLSQFSRNPSDAPRDWRSGAMPLKSIFLFRIEGGVGGCIILLPGSVALICFTRVQKAVARDVELQLF